LWYQCVIGLTLFGFLTHTNSILKFLPKKCIGVHVIFLKLKHHHRMMKLFCFYYAMLSKNKWPSGFDVTKKGHSFVIAAV